MAVAILPGGDATPADDTRVEVALFEEEAFGGIIEVGTVEIPLVARRVETIGFLLDGLRVGILGEDDVAIVGEPLAGVHKAQIQVVHHKVDGATVGIAHVTLVGVLAHVEVEAGVTIIVEGAKRLMSRRAQS